MLPQCKSPSSTQERHCFPLCFQETVHLHPLDRHVWARLALDSKNSYMSSSKLGLFGFFMHICCKSRSIFAFICGTAMLFFVSLLSSAAIARCYSPYSLPDCHTSLTRCVFLQRESLGYLSFLPSSYRPSLSLSLSPTTLYVSG